MSHTLTTVSALRCHCGEAAGDECGTPCCACMDHWIAEGEPEVCPCGNTGAALATSPAAAVASAPTVSPDGPGEQRGRLGWMVADARLREAAL